MAGFVAEDSEVYEKEELEKLFEAYHSEERLWFEFFLITGMRGKDSDALPVGRC